MAKTKEEIEEMGYTYVGEKTKSPADWDVYEYPYSTRGIIVYKDGYYGVLDINTGEEISPCVHLSGTDAINDIYILHMHSKDKNDRKFVSVQKVLKDNLDEFYNPYVGSVARLMMDIFGLPNGIFFTRNWTGCELNEENFVKTVLRLYESVAEIMKNGGKKLLIHNLKPTKEITEYGRSLERIINGEFMYRVRREYSSLTPEEEKELFDNSDYYDKKEDDYVELEPALSTYVALRRYDSNIMNADRTEYFNKKRPCIEIGPSETSYFPDLNEYDKKISFVQEEFTKGAALEMPIQK